MKPSTRQRVVMISLDSTEHTLIEPWIEDGTLPNLAALKRQGCYGTLESTVNWLVGTPWPTMLTSTWPSEHGHNGFMVWRPQTMTPHRVANDWLPWTPFYRRLSQFGRHVIATDVPMVYPPDPFNGIEISSWTGHDKLSHSHAHPKAIRDWAFGTYGANPVHPEVGGLEPIAALRELREVMIESTRILGQANRKLMREQPWDLFITGFGAGHRAGHKLWDDAAVLGDVSEQDRAFFPQAMKDIHVEMDRQLGLLLEAVPDDAVVLVFSLHGMGPSTSRAILLPDMLDRVLHNKRIDAKPDAARHAPGLLKRLRQAVPNEYRAAIKAKLPVSFQDALTRFWQPKPDWRQTRAMAFGGLEGYIQINLKGREREGIVEPGHEYEALIEQISEGLMTFRDADTGEPLVARIGRGPELFPTLENNHMPDLVVVWNDTPARHHRLIASDRYGTVNWPVADRTPDGCAGHHRSTGWLAARGPGIRSQARLDQRHILDLAPTVMTLMGLEPFPEMRGQPIDVLLSRMLARKAVA